jgi:hypothetical protein
MAHASRKGFGPGAKGKGDGSGGLTNMPEAMMKEGENLSNRDRRGRGARGMDGKFNEMEGRPENQTAEDAAWPTKVGG